MTQTQGRDQPVAKRNETILCDFPYGPHSSVECTVSAAERLGGQFMAYLTTTSAFSFVLLFGVAPKSA
jgi:hypothetical protein